MEVAAGQTRVDDKVMWWFSGRCRSCDMQVESDGEAPMPDEYRDLILRSSGHYGVHVLNRSAMSLNVIRKATLRSVADISPLELPGLVATGTETEMRLLYDNLVANGLNQSEVELRLAPP